MSKKSTLLRSERNARWIEKYCRVPEGKFVGQKITLTKKQRGWLRKIYDSPTRTYILSMGRKNAKTAFSAMLALLHLCGPEAKENSQLFSAAQSREQAAILFNLAAKMVRMSPDLLAEIDIRESGKQLFCPALGSLYRALSAEASTAYGFSPVFTVHDELGQVRGPRSELYDALETASAAQDAPLSIIISTQATTDADLLSVLIDDALTGADPRVKIDLYTAPMKDEKTGKELDPFAESTIRLANPHFDDFMNKDEVMGQARRAKRLPVAEASFRNLILNQRVESREPFITRSVWLGNTGNGERIPAGAAVWGGLDLSSVNDLTSLELIAELDDAIVVDSTFWLPEEGLEQKAKDDRVPYDVWHKSGFLTTTPGASIEYQFVAKHLRKVFDTYDVQGIAFDRYNMKFLKPWLVAEGFSEEELERFIEFGQGFISMSPAIRACEELLLQNKISHGDNPILTMCMANVRVVRDDADNRKFTKSRSSGRIDGAVALVMAIGAAKANAVESDTHDNPVVDLN